MGEPVVENGEHGIHDGSQSSASSDHNGSCNGLLNGINGSSNTSAQLNVNKQAPDLEYLTQLLKDKKQLAAFPNVFAHVERLLDDEINRVRVSIFQCEFQREPLHLPDSVGDISMRQEKVFVPVKSFPEYNFVGRILGPRGMTAKQLEAETGCKIMVRGKGSMRDKKKEDMNRGKPNWEHLQEELHVLIQCEDTPNRAELKINRAIEEVKKLLVPSPEGEDELKKKQLMELAIINGTYRNGAGAQNSNAANQLAVAAAAAAAGMNGKGFLSFGNGLSLPSANCSIRSPGLAGAPLIMQSASQMATSRGSGFPPTSMASAQTNATIAAAQAQAALAMQLQGMYNGAGLGNPQASAGVDYQQLLLNSMQYDPNVMAQVNAMQQQQQQQAQLAAVMLQASGGGGGGLLGDPYGAGAALDLANAGSILSQQRRFLGQSRDHPYGKREGT